MLPAGPVPATDSDPSMYAVAMGDSFSRLDSAVQQFHRLSGNVSLSGYVEVERPHSTLACLVGRLLGTPTQRSRGPFSLDLAAQASTETWTRHFPTRRMSSTLSLHRTTLVEKLGAAKLTFSLHEQKGQLKMRLEALRFLGIACPKWLMPEITAVESGEKRRLRFQIEARIPRIGLVAAYRGWLDLGTIDRNSNGAPRDCR